MTTIFKVLFVQIVFVMFMAGPSLASGPYVFKPLDPNATPQERLKAANIPQDIIETMSTEDLIETCFNYPFKLDFYAYNSYEEGLAAMIENFNGFQELLRREDGASLLLERYISINPSKIAFPPKNTDGKFNKKRLLDAFYPLDNIKLTELLLNHQIIFFRLMTSEKKILGEETINKIRQYNQCPRHFVSKGRRDTTAQIMTRYIELLEESGDKISVPRIIRADKDEHIERLIEIVRKYIARKRDQ